MARQLIRFIPGFVTVIVLIICKDFLQYPLHYAALIGVAAGLFIGFSIFLVQHKRNKL